MQNDAEKIGVRIILAGIGARGRLHLRRILVGDPAIEIVGTIRPGMCVDDILKRGLADLVLIDSSESPDEAKHVLAEVLRHNIKALFLAAPNVSPTLTGAPRAITLERPPALENEASHTPFGMALRNRLLNSCLPERTPVRPVSEPRPRRSLRPERPELIAIGSSTGGPQALPEVLSRLKGLVRQPILITQHMPANFTRMLASHLTRYTAEPTVEAVDGMPVQPGHVYLAPGDKHLLVTRKAEQIICQLSDGPPEHFCRPAVDPMLRSITSTLGGRALAVILTGMGSDGLAGCRSLVEAGGTVFAQDKATSVVWGMPGAVAQAGLCRSVAPLKQLGSDILAFLGDRP